MWFIEGSRTPAFKAEIPKGWDVDWAGSWRTLACLFFGRMSLKKEKKKKKK